ncbi:hypothetical protein C5167_026488 [Papaver somniferum]|uniref:uncharacterized protein LOC113326752 n=1 Tax=Papaver somniferum TaxID=3469 RepID=UPI000E6FE961|nr:uncharacterized protein LOC113326752 [Papaver somniferum]RZC85816.1 hypothetical protein C5167_026488 [Papaver somniferum]
MDLKEQNDLLIDLESGGSEEEAVILIVNNKEQQQEPIASKARNLLDKAWNGIITSSIDVITGGGGEDGKNAVANGDLENGGEVVEKRCLLQGGGGGEDTLSPLLVVKKKEKKSKTKVSAPKPPRPPRGPSLDAADQKLIREISELAMLKRARIERMRAHKKMKASKAASSNSNMYAMIITVMFCLVIIVQGLSSRGSSQLSFQGSPQSAVTMRGGKLISVQYFKNKSAPGTDGPGSASPSLVEQVSGPGADEEGKTRVAG